MRLKNDDAEANWDINFEKTADTHLFSFFLIFFLNLHLNKAMMYKLAWMQILPLHQFVWATGV